MHYRLATLSEDMGDSEEALTSDSTIDDTADEEASSDEGDAESPVTDPDTPPEERPRPEIGELHVDKVTAQSQEIDQQRELNEK